MPWSKLRYRLGLEQIQPPRYVPKRKPPPAAGSPEAPPKTKRTTRDPFEQAEAMRKELQAGKVSWAPGPKRKARR